MNALLQLFQNYVLNVALISWLAAQIIKTVLYCIKNKTLDLERLIGAGGMPSSHTATVSSLVIAISKQEGFTSPEFAIAFILAAIVMYDATGVRRAAGEQAKILNQIVKNQNDDDETKELKEYLGHTPLEVLGGALLGIIVAMIVPMN